MTAQSIPAIAIGRRRVGLAEPCYIIAEAGSNHDGRLEQAYCLIDTAAEAGADAVKFQNFRADKLYPPTAGRSDYLGDQRNIYDIIHAMEMPPEWLPKLAERAKSRGVAFLSSAFDEASVDLIAPYVDAFKCASYEMTHTPLLAHMARLGKPVILSTGTATLDEVGEAVNVVRACGNPSIVVLQCTAAYPAPLASINARALVTMREAFNVLTGLSDHSRDAIVAPMTAVALSAVMLEKHFTLSNRLPGPDHPFSLEPAELFELVRRVRQVEQALGDGKKEVHDVEHELRSFARRSIFTTRVIEPGDLLTEDNTAVLRCGKLRYGLPPVEYARVLGGAARHRIEAHTSFTWDDIEPRAPAPTPLSHAADAERDAAARAPGGGVALRSARPEDNELVFRINNAPETRRVSRNTDPIPWDDHKLWYQRRLADPSVFMWIIEEHDKPVGVVRIEPEESANVISIALSQEAQGRGVGSAAIRIACARLHSHAGEAVVRAYIKPDNTRSLRAFERAGFAPKGEDIQPPQGILVLERRAGGSAP